MLDWFAGARDESIDELVRRKRYGKAVKLLRAELEKRKNDRRLRLRLGEILVLAGQLPEGVKLLSKVADDMALHGQVAQAIAVLKKIEAIEPGREDVEDKLAYLVERRVNPSFDPWKRPAGDEDGPGPGTKTPCSRSASSWIPARRRRPRPRAASRPRSRRMDRRRRCVRRRAAQRDPRRHRGHADPDERCPGRGGGRPWRRRRRRGHPALPQPEPGGAGRAHPRPAAPRLRAGPDHRVRRRRRRQPVRPDQRLRPCVRAQHRAAAGPGAPPPGRRLLRRDLRRSPAPPRTATITAASRCELLELDKATLDRIAETHPHVREVLQEFHDQRKDNTLETLSRAVRLPGR